MVSTIRQPITSVVTLTCILAQPRNPLQTYTTVLAELLSRGLKEGARREMADSILLADEAPTFDDKLG
jgi:hypothetical protein